MTIIKTLCQYNYEFYIAYQNNYALSNRIYFSSLRTTTVPKQSVVQIYKIYFSGIL